MQLVPVFVTASYLATGRGLLPLEHDFPAHNVPGNVPAWTLGALAGLSVLWGTAVARAMNPELPVLTLTEVTSRAHAAAELLRSTAAAFPRAPSVILGRLRPQTGSGGGPWWTLVEVDGRTLRATPDAASIDVALAAAGLRLEEGDRVVVVPNQGRPLADGHLAQAGQRGQVEQVEVGCVVSPLAACAYPAGALPVPSQVMPAGLPLSAAPGLLDGSARSAGGRLVVQRALPFTVVDSGVPAGARAAASTVGEALRSAGIDVDEADLVQPPVDAQLLPGMRVSVQRAQPVTIQGIDLSLQTRTRAATVAELLVERGVTLGPLDRAEPWPDEAVPAGGTVRVFRGREERRTDYQVLPFRTVIQYDESLSPGARLRVRAGTTGLLERVTKLVFEDEREVRRALVGETLVRPQVDEIMAIGPAVIPVVALPGVSLAAAPQPAPVGPPAAPSAPPAGGVAVRPAAEAARPAQPAAPAPAFTSPQPVAGVPEGMQVQRTLMMVATAYDPGPASTGKRPGDPGYGITASGIRAGYGVVAVDPRVIPLGTRLYIPSYGAAVAGDTGGAIKGNRIDLGFASHAEAIRFGRQTVTVYVLK